MGATKALGINQKILNIIKYYIGGTAEELFIIYKKYIKIETDKAYCLPE